MQHKDHLFMVIHVYSVFVFVSALRIRDTHGVVKDHIEVIMHES